MLKTVIGFSNSNYLCIWNVSYDSVVNFVDRQIYFYLKNQKSEKSMCVICFIYTIHFFFFFCTQKSSNHVFNGKADGGKARQHIRIDVISSEKSITYNTACCDRPKSVLSSSIAAESADAPYCTTYTECGLVDVSRITTRHLARTEVRQPFFRQSRPDEANLLFAADERN